MISARNVGNVRNGMEDGFKTVFAI